MEYTSNELHDLLGTNSFQMYKRLDTYIMNSYNVTQAWSKGGKHGQACLRYTRGGKTLCTLYIREEQLGIWIILGKEERRKFEDNRNRFSCEVQGLYDATQVFHDGKWLMFDVENDSLFDEIILMLQVKKTPNKKPI